jgi:hypothetical protein
MAMPEAPMDEDDLLTAAEHEVRLAREIAAMQPVPVAHSVRDSSDSQLRRGILAADFPHIGTAPFWR